MSAPAPARYLRPLLTGGLGALLLLVTSAVRGQTAAPLPWQGESIYQVVTDRFFNGDPSNDNAEGNLAPGAGQGVHGGDFRGLEARLDYVKSLGATAVWISPVVRNGRGDYHGYAGRDFYATAPQMGSLADLQRLTAAAHARGLKVVADVVVNHGANLVTSDDPGYPAFRAAPAGYNLRLRDGNRAYAPPFDLNAAHPTLQSLFHNQGDIGNYGVPAQVEQGSLQTLDDFRTETPFIREQMAAVYAYWITQAGFDAFRVDTVKHVEHGFWQSWCPAIRQAAASAGKPDFFLFGEVYDGSDAKCAAYTGTRAGGAFELDSALDYPLYFAVNSVFARGTANTRQLEDHFRAVDNLYEPAARGRLVTFLDNHDQPRFLNSANANNKPDRLRLALTFLLTARGVPCLYYGTEQGFNGGADPGNREDMFAGGFEQGPSAGDNFNPVHPLFQFVARLNNLRRLYPALTLGSQAPLWNNPDGPGLFAYARRLGAQEVFVALNTADLAQRLPERPSRYPAGTVLVNVLAPNESMAVNAAGNLPALDVPAVSAKVFVAQAEVRALDPVVIAVSPAHDARRVPTPSRIALSFSRPMDRASVEAAFSTVPATPGGTFAWTDAGDAFTYTVPGGLPALSNVAVRLADTARDAAGGQRLFAPVETRFTTAAATVVDVLPPTVVITSPRDGDTLTDITDVRGAAGDDTGLASVEIRLDNGNWVSATGFGNQPTQTTWGHPLYTRYYLNGAHTISARSTDAAGNLSAVTTVRVRYRNVPGDYEQAFFAYGSAGYGVQDCEGAYWSSDRPYEENLQYFSYGFLGGNVARSQNPIAGVCDQAQVLYQSERYSASPNEGFRYLFNCPPGVYEVTLLDAETFMNGPNQRRFDVYLQGEKVLASFDIFTAAGGANRGVTRTFTTNVANALLEVELKPVFDRARLSAVRVRKVADLFSDNDGVADWWRLAHFGHPTGLAADGSRAGDDPDGDGRTNREEFLARTDPNDPASWLRVVKVERLNQDVQISWTVAAGAVYQVQRSDSLLAPVWTDVGSPQTAYYPGTSFFTDYGGAAPGVTQRFYRVIAR